MTRLLNLIKGIDMTDLALVAGTTLLWIGLDRLFHWLPFVVVGGLLLLYGATPMVLTVGRRK